MQNTSQLNVEVVRRRGLLQPVNFRHKNWKKMLFDGKDCISVYYPTAPDIYEIFLWTLPKNRLCRTFHKPTWLSRVEWTLKRHKWHLIWSEPRPLRGVLPEGVSRLLSSNHWERLAQVLAPRCRLVALLMLAFLADTNFLPTNCCQDRVRIIYAFLGSIQPWMAISYKYQVMLALRNIRINKCRHSNQLWLCWIMGWKIQ